MERVALILNQLEEAKRFILVDTVSYLRMALLLLDNVAEVLMHRVIKEEFSHDEFYRRIYELMKEVPDPAKKKEFFKKFEVYTNPGKKEKRDIKIL